MIAWEGVDHEHGCWRGVKISSRRSSGEYVDGTKVFFMPYDPKNPKIVVAQHEYGSVSAEMNKNQKQIEHELAKGNEALSVWYDGKKHPTLMSMSLGDVYIRGHGMPGFKSIEGGRGGERVDYDVVCDRLISSGLPKMFQGKIKCFICHSAEEGKVGSDPEVIGPAFARSVANYMFTRGYRSCTYYGYLGAADSFVKDGPSGTHKYVREKVKGQQVALARASEARVQFHPEITLKRPHLLSRIFRKS